MIGKHINVSAISPKSVLGKCLRFPLHLIPQSIVMPVLQGRLKGKKWIVGSGNHGCWLGSYEHEKQFLFADTINEGTVVYDIGAHAGFYTLLASELVGPRGKVVAFEPLPGNIHYLKKHLRINQCDNVILIEAAVAEKNGVGFIEEGAVNYTGKLSVNSGIEIKTVNLDDLVSNGEIPAPDYMKIDVEGSEMLVLAGAKSLLSDIHPSIFLSTHGNEIHQQCCTFLRSISYELQFINKEDKDESDEIMASKD